MMKKLYIVLCLLLSFMSVGAQNSTQGKEFWFSYMRNGYDYQGLLEMQVMISAKRACSGTVSHVNNPPLWHQSFEVPANGVVVITVPRSCCYHELEVEQVTSMKAMKVTATDTVSVYISNHAKKSFDASYVLPVESLGSDYIIQTDKQSATLSSHHDMETSSFLIVATQDGTQVDITPSVPTLGGHLARQTFTVSMNAGQTYFVRSTRTNRDLSGSVVCSHGGKPIAVFNGNTVTAVPIESLHEMSADHIFEQAIPVDKWGTQFAVTGSANRARDYVKVTSAAYNDTVWKNGDYLTTLDFGESYEFSLLADEGSCFIETSDPSMVFLYNTSGTDTLEFGTSPGDPSMILIPPVEQRIYDIAFCTFNNAEANIDNHFVNVVVPKEGKDKVYLDGTLIDEADFQPVRGTEDFFFMRKEIAHATHHLSCLGGVIAHVYGFAHAKGYGYCTGANMITLNSKMFVNEVWSESYRDGVWACSTDDVKFKVETNYPITKVTWDFGLPETVNGEEVEQHFPEAGDYEVKAFIEGVALSDQNTVYDTLSVIVHVGMPYYQYDEMTVCDMDSVGYQGVYFKQTGEYRLEDHDIFGCDSTYILTLDMEFTPNFEFVGTHWPIGGSETHISVNEYAIRLLDSRAHIDTVLWQIDCPNWYVLPHGDKGKECTLSIFSYLQEPIMLHAWLINRCDTVHEEFFIQTSYFDVGETDESVGFDVSPNPTDGNVTLRFDKSIGMAEVLVYNSLGWKVDAFFVDTNQCHEKVYVMPNLKNGLYYFVLDCNGARVSKKTILSR